MEYYSNQEESKFYYPNCFEDEYYEEEKEKGQQKSCCKRVVINARVCCENDWHNQCGNSKPKQDCSKQYPRFENNGEHGNSQQKSGYRNCCEKDHDKEYEKEDNYCKEEKKDKENCGCNDKKEEKRCRRGLFSGFFRLF